MTEVREARSRRGAYVALLFGAVVMVAAACTQNPTVPTETTTTTSTVPECVPTSGSATSSSGATINVSQVNCLEVGDVVTVTGSGFTSTGNLGSRPPLAGQPAGVYAVFGEFADPWRPSQGAPSANRKILSQMWAIPAPSYSVLGGASGTVLMAPDGSFTADVTIAASTSTHPTIAFATYGGSGSVNADEELQVLASFDS
jgi:large repetitive protein